ncbi:hypothetical protein F4780DRAFT_237987 [Xylariomycetidae sp. FL0641]|nr:hypothetical protein F4780DRAFT_237987 [Xylariomycetidae sp. FL0641]
MGDFGKEFQQELKVQSWSLYSVGITIIFFRLYARARRLGSPANYQVDDYLMMLAAALYTTLMICLNVITQGGGSNLYPPELTGTFTEKEVAERIFGSKVVVVSEQAMLNCIYAIKVCMLIMYTRLTLGLNQQRAVRYLALYVGAGWFASETAFFTACVPFAGYWGMPPPDPQCTTLQYYAIVTGCCNISSDLLMLGIPIPLVLRSIGLPGRQKIVLVLIFGLGLFVVVAALLTKVFNLSNIWDPGYMLWYTREASVAVYVSNLPMIWPLLREWFPVLKTLNPSNYTPRSASGSPRRGYRVGSEAIGSVQRGARTANDVSSSRSRPSRRHSLSSSDTKWDVEMAMPAKHANKEASWASQTIGSNLANKKPHEECHEYIVANRGIEHGPGGIQVERSVIIQERRLRIDETPERSWGSQVVVTSNTETVST